MVSGALTQRDGSPVDLFKVRGVRRFVEVDIKGSKWRVWQVHSAHVDLKHEASRFASFKGDFAWVCLDFIGHRGSDQRFAESLQAHVREEGDHHSNYHHRHESPEGSFEFRLFSVSDELARWKKVESL